VGQKKDFWVLQTRQNYKVGLNRQSNFKTSLCTNEYQENSYTCLVSNLVILILLLLFYYDTATLIDCYLCKLLLDSLIYLFIDLFLE